MKKILGAYPTLEKTTAKVERLQKEGYRSDNITVVAKEERIKAIKDQIIAEFEAVTTEEEPDSIWGKVKQVFSNDEDDPLEKYGFNKKQIEDYTKAIKNGEYVVIIDDETDPSNYDQEKRTIPITPTINNSVPGFGAGPIIPGIVRKSGAVKDDSNEDENR